MPALIDPASFTRAGLDAGLAATWAEAANDILRRHPGPDAASQEAAWRDLGSGLLRARTQPFDAHRILYHWVYQRRDVARDGPGPAWFPATDALERSNLAPFLRDAGVRTYEEFHAWSARHRDSFWTGFVERIRPPFEAKPTHVRDPKSPLTSPRWLPGARLNVAELCFRAPANKPAIVYASEAEPAPRRLSYQELDQLTARVAAGLDRLGLGRSERVALYLPMTPESVAAYLGIVRSGRAAVGIADASAPADVAKRIKISEAKALVTIDAYPRDGKMLRVFEKAKEADAPPAIVLPAEGADVAGSALRPRDVWWDDFLAPSGGLRPAPRGPDDETNILFSSGTTKDPKAIVWTHTTPLKCVMDAHLHHDVKAEDILAWPTSFGWMMGPWLTYASLAHGATMALYNGSPLSRAFGEFIQNERVTMLGVVPKLVRNWRTKRTMEGLDWSHVRRFSSTGETSDPEDMLYLMWLAGYRPIIEYCGGTEIGGGYVTGTMVQPAAPATFTTPACGLDFVLLDEEGKAARRGEVGILPPSIGLSNRILNYDHDKEYYAGFFRGPDGEILRRHGDQLERLGSHHLRHHGRVDDMINLNGVKTSVEELRAVVTRHPLVYDAKPIAIDVEGRGQRSLVIYAIPKDAKRVTDQTLRVQLVQEFGALIKERLNPLLSHVHDVVLVTELPQAGPGKTRTQKEFVKDYEARYGPKAMTPRP